MRPVYARPRATGSTGVGLVCIREVPADTVICSCSNQDQYRTVSAEDFGRLHPSEQTFYNELFDPMSADGTFYELPANPEILEMVCFVNHSSTPSCRYDATRHSLVTKRPLQEGDEITVDYSNYLESHHHNRKYAMITTNI